ncbi:MAG TPA: hypothetical protein VK046_03880, partial [Actinomycetaceae bacterium]|nr:hypothetical protein [Actinomycetaceae bacterium]
MTADLHPDTGLPRPDTCCGVCPPIADGGWDCTCEGMPGCPANEPGLVRTRAERDAVAQDLARLAARLAAVEAEHEALADSLRVEAAQIVSRVSDEPMRQPTPVDELLG